MAIKTAVSYQRPPSPVELAVACGPDDGDLVFLQHTAPGHVYVFASGEIVHHSTIMEAWRRGCAGTTPVAHQAGEQARIIGVADLPNTVELAPSGPRRTIGTRRYNAETGEIEDVIFTATSIDACTLTREESSHGEVHQADASGR